jgi:hypothetical protein
MSVIDDRDFPLVKHGPTDPVESFRSCVLQAIIKHRGEDGINKVKMYLAEIDEYLATYERAGYSNTQVLQFRDIADRAKAKAREDGRVFAYLWF